MNDKAIHQARALYYIFFAKIFSFVEHAEQYAELEELLDVFIANPLDEVSQEAFIALKEAFSTNGVEGLKNEYDNVFVSPDTSFIPLTASYYDEGRDDGQKRVKAAGFVLRSKFRRNTPVCNDSEDHVLFLFRLMNKLLEAGIDGQSDDLALSKEVFAELINDFIDEFVELLYRHENGHFYKETALILKAFVDFERFYLNVKPSEKVMSAERVSKVIQQDRKPLTQRVKRNLDEIVL